MQNAPKKMMNALEQVKLYVSNSYFKRGYDSIYKGLLFDYDIAYRSDALSYEKGRAFAIFIQQHNLPKCAWRAGKLSKAGQLRLWKAIADKWVI